MIVGTCWYMIVLVKDGSDDVDYCIVVIMSIIVYDVTNVNPVTYETCMTEALPFQGSSHFLVYIQYMGS
jgi:hypothetical protein